MMIASLQRALRPLACSVSTHGHPISALGSFLTATSFSTTTTTTNAASGASATAAAVYERIAEKTLQSLYDQFDALLPYASLSESTSQSARVEDCEYSQGVLTLSMVTHPGPESSTKAVYVLNKQPPNRQLWLSSPLSGPKRFDYADLEEACSRLKPEEDACLASSWKDKRDGTRLDQLLSKELSVFFRKPIVIQ